MTLGEARALAAAHPGLMAGWRGNEETAERILQYGRNGSADRINPRATESTREGLAFYVNTTREELAKRAPREGRTR